MKTEQGTLSLQSQTKQQSQILHSHYFTVYRLSSQLLSFIEQYIVYLCKFELLEDHDDKTNRIVTNYVQPLLQYLCLCQEIKQELCQMNAPFGAKNAERASTTQRAKRDVAALEKLIETFLFLRCDRTEHHERTNVQWVEVTEWSPFPHFVAPVQMMDTFIKTSAVDVWFRRMIQLGKANPYFYCLQTDELSYDQFMQQLEIPKDLWHQIFDCFVEIDEHKSVIRPNYFDSCWRTKYLEPFIRLNCVDWLKHRLNIINKSYHGAFLRMLITKQQESNYCSNYGKLLIVEQYDRSIASSGVLQQENKQLRELWKKYLDEKLDTIRDLKNRLQAMNINHDWSRWTLRVNALRQLLSSSTQIAVQKSSEYSSIMYHCYSLFNQMSEISSESLDKVIKLMKLANETNGCVSYVNSSEVVMWILHKSFVHKIVDILSDGKETIHVSGTSQFCNILMSVVSHLYADLKKRSKPGNTVDRFHENEWIAKLIRGIYRTMSRIQSNVTYYNPSELHDKLSKLQAMIQRACKRCTKALTKTLNPENLVVCLTTSYPNAKRYVSNAIETLSLIDISIKHAKGDKAYYSIVIDTMSKAKQRTKEENLFSQSPQFRYDQLQASMCSMCHSVMQSKPRSVFTTYLSNVKKIKLYFRMILSNFTNYGEGEFILLSIDSLKNWRVYENQLRFLEGNGFKHQSDSHNMLCIVIFMAFGFDKSFSGVDSITYQKAKQLVKATLPNNTTERIKELSTVFRTGSQLAPGARHTFFQSDKEWFFQITKSASPLWIQCFSDIILPWILMEQIIGFEKTSNRSSSASVCRDTKMGVRSIIDNQLTISKNIARLLSIGSQEPSEALVALFCFELLPWLSTSKELLFDVCLVRQLIGKQFNEFTIDCMWYLTLSAMPTHSVPNTLEWIDSLLGSMSIQNNEQMLVCIELLKQARSDTQLGKVEQVQGLRRQLCNLCSPTEQ